VKWKRGQRSANLEDRRGQRGGSSSGGLGGLGGGGRGGGLPLPTGKGGVGAVVLVVVVLLIVGSRIFGGDGTGFDTGGAFDGFGTGPDGGGQIPSGDEKLADFASFVLDDVQGYWAVVFRDAGRTYGQAKMVLFSGATRTACGPASSATGPFYCPADQKVYLDLGFFRELRDRFGAPGDFAQAYVIAHELGHHVQDELGINAQVQEASQRDLDSANDLSIRLELQADCLAGVWAHSVDQRGDLEAGDIEEGLNAAASVGDDRIQEATTGRTDPESWTHGSAEQRSRWFRAGFDGGEISACDTFSGDV
jgi:predicted metalloprotease